MRNSPYYETLDSWVTKPRKYKKQIDETLVEHQLGDEIAKDRYVPVHRNKKGERSLSSIIEKNSKNYVCSGKEILNMAILADEFTTKNNEGVFQHVPAF